MPQGDKGKYTDKQKRKAEIVRRKYSAPYNWAPFVLIGDWR